MPTGYLLPQTAPDQFKRAKERLSDLERKFRRPLGSGARPGGGKPYATVVVAAADSVAAGAANADFVCPGGSDDTTIREAIEAAQFLDAAGGQTAGRVLLLEGTYKLGGSISMVDGLTLEGQGFGTYLMNQEADGTGVLIDTNAAGVWQIRNMRLGGCENCIRMQNVGVALIEGCSFYGGGIGGEILGDAIWMSLCDYIEVRDCSFVLPAGFGIHMDGFVQWSLFAHNFFDSCGNPTTALGHAERGSIGMIGPNTFSNSISDNVFTFSADHSIYCNGGNFSTIKGNLFNGVADFTSTGFSYEVELAGGDNFLVVSNNFQSGAVDEFGILVGSAAFETLVALNAFQTYEFAVTVQGDDVSVQGNLFTGCDTAVEITAAASRTLIDGNTFRNCTTEMDDLGTGSDTGAGNWIDGVWVGCCTGGGASALDDLTDVTITSPATGAMIKYNGSQWIDDLITLDELSDVQYIFSPSAGQFLVWDGGAGSWINQTVVLDDIADVDASPDDRDVLAFDSGSGDWVARPTGRLAINAQTGTTYTPVLADVDKLVTLLNASPITLTLPQDSDLAVPVGDQIHFAQIGAGQVTAAAGTGATVNATPGLKWRAQYSTVTAIKRAANTWLLVGDLSA